MDQVNPGRTSKLPKYLLGFLVAAQIVLLATRSFIFGWRGKPEGGGGGDTAIAPFFLFFVLLPSFLASKKGGLLPEKYRGWLLWALVVLAGAFLLAMVLPLF